MIHDLLSAVRLLSTSAFAIVVLAARLTADPPPNELVIATWNLEWFFDYDTSDNRSETARKLSAPSQKAWEWRRDRVAEAIAKIRPTIMALQEIENRHVLVELTDQLRKQHNLSYRVAFIEGIDSATEQDVGILYQSGLVEYSRREQSKEMFESEKYYNMAKHLFARFEWQVEGRTESLLVMTVHLRSGSDSADLRLRQARLVHHWLQPYLERGENVIVMGDFNFEELAGQGRANGETAELLGTQTPDTRDDLVDLLERVPIEKRRTHLFLDRQFDRIFISQALRQDTRSRRDLVFQSISTRPELVIRGKGIDEDHWATRYAEPLEERDISDHYPLVARFKFQ